MRREDLGMPSPKYPRRFSKKTCTIDGCGKMLLANGMCSMHYNRQRRRGSPFLRNKAANGELAAWLNEHVLCYEGDDCQEWPFQKICNGRGGISIDGKTVLVARVVCERVHGPAPTPDHETAHSCGHAWCVTKRHVRWATHVENEADKILHGTHLRGEKIGTSRWNEGQIRFIRNSSMSARQIEEFMGVGRDYVYSIRGYKVWKHIQP
jgi:hypothetical protein